MPLTQPSARIFLVAKGVAKTGVPERSAVRANRGKQAKDDFPRQRVRLVELFAQAERSKPSDNGAILRATPFSYMLCVTWVKVGGRCGTLGGTHGTLQ
jgi:hypothetical protein